MDRQRFVLQLRLFRKHRATACSGKAWKAEKYIVVFSIDHHYSTCIRAIACSG